MFAVNFSISMEMGTISKMTLCKRGGQFSATVPYAVNCHHNVVGGKSSPPGDMVLVTMPMEQVTFKQKY